MEGSAFSHWSGEDWDQLEAPSGQKKSNNLLQKADQVICFPGSWAASD